MKGNQNWRKTSQPLLPARYQAQERGHYELFPAFTLGGGQIEVGFAGLAERLVNENVVVADGFSGVFWDHFQRHLDTALSALGVAASWHAASDALLAPVEIERLIAPYIDNGDPVFGQRFDGELRDFFDEALLSQLQPDPDADLNILYGPGAALAGWQGLLVYVDVPKNEIQYRSRAGAICNLGAEGPAPATAMYKRFYYVDWVVASAHKAKLLPRLDLYVDEQRRWQPAWIHGRDLRAALGQLTHSCFRARPWFEPGVWGGHWCEAHIPQLPSDVPNYAWSFEFITPENGILLESDGRLLEISFDMLLFHDRHALVGDCADAFGNEFPVRFNFLDTVNGGELAVQCHPGYEYIRDHFGETFTQDESYYILDCEKEARVYLGFQDGVEPGAFRRALEQSFERREPLDIERYVNVERSHKHDYFLLPAETIHAAGVNNLVLEISATPYIFTFKLYDYLVEDFNGELRPLHLEQGFKNLNFEHKGPRITQELISQPELVRRGRQWKLWHFPTHRQHFYQVHRYDFAATFEAETGSSFHLMSLVEGQRIVVETENGRRLRVHYAETFIVPAAAGRYRLINEGEKPAKVVVASMKEGATPDWALRVANGERL